MCSISLISASSYAGETPPPPIVAAGGKEVILIEKGTEAPFKGYLFPEEKALNFRKELIELDHLKRLQESYEKSITLYKNNEYLQDHKTTVLLEQNEKLVNQLSTAKARDDWENKLWFFLGVFVTGAGAYVFSKAK